MNSQESTDDQLTQLIDLANKQGFYENYELIVEPIKLVALANQHGLYDAADAVKRIFQLDTSST